MRRTQIYLSEQEVRTLEKVSRSTGRTKSQLIRMAVDEMFLAAKPGALLDSLQRSHGSWRGRSETGADQVEKLRNGRLNRVLQASR